VVTLSIPTVGPNASLHRVVSHRDRILIPFSLSVMGVLLAGLGRGRRNRRGDFVVCMVMILTLSWIMLACGGGSPGATTPAPPVVNVQISPTSASLFTAQMKQFSATVSGTSNTQVTWGVNGTAGGNSMVGTVDPTGLYTAPGAAPGAAVSVSAVSQADSTKFASANVTINSPTPNGGYTIIVTAMLGGIQHTIPVVLTVQ
jgi:hypothetical protein